MASDESVGEAPEADAEISVRECWELLRAQAYGRLALTGDDGPEIFPINMLVDRGSIVFRTESGTKLDALHADPRAVFEVDGLDTDTAWSVIVHGIAHVVTDTYEGIEVVELGVTPWQDGPKSAFVRIEPTTVSGRRFERTGREAWTIPEAHRTTSVD